MNMYLHFTSRVRTEINHTVLWLELLLMEDSQYLLMLMADDDLVTQGHISKNNMDLVCQESEFLIAMVNAAMS